MNVTGAQLFALFNKAFKYIGSYSNSLLVGYILYAVIFKNAMLKANIPYISTSTYSALHKQLLYFLLILALNMTVNIVLKYSIQEPRPVDKSHYGLGYDYGMPSGHAQTATLLLLILFSINAPLIIRIVSTLLVIIIYIHRYIFQYHTLNQIIGGIVVGGTMWKLLL